jgi:hypothetical protein
MKRPIVSSILVSLLCAAPFFGAATACGGGSDNLPPPPPPPPPAPSSLANAKTTETPPAPVALKDEPKAPELPAITLTPGTAAPDPTAPLPTVKITAPGKDQVVPADKAAEFLVKLDVKNWATATGSSHVHLILDNKPYKAIYDTKAGVKLLELTGGEPLTEGQHVLVAFPSRASHESVKTKDALVVTQFFVGKKGEAKTDLKKPMLIYSRPKGDYKGEMANHVLIDFQVAGVTLAEGKEHVNVSVTGPGIGGELTAKVDKFGTPLYLDHLRNGDYKLKVELVDAEQKLIAGPWNQTSRSIHVDRDAPADPMGHPMPAGATMPGAASAVPAATVAPKASAAPKAPAAPATSAAPKK